MNEKYYIVRADRGIDIDGTEWTVAEFVELCKDSYGGSTIRRLEDGTESTF